MLSLSLPFTRTQRRFLWVIRISLAIKIAAIAGLLLTLKLWGVI
jgi:hypothetical protein